MALASYSAPDPERSAESLPRPDADMALASLSALGPGHGQSAQTLPFRPNPNIDMESASPPPPDPGQSARTLPHCPNININMASLPSSDREQRAPTPPLSPPPSPDMFSMPSLPSGGPQHEQSPEPLPVRPNTNTTPLSASDFPVDVAAISSDPDFEITSMFYYSAGLMSPTPIDPLGRFYLFPYTIDRLRAAAEAFQWPLAVQRLNNPFCWVQLLGELATHLQIHHGVSNVHNHRHCFVVRVAFKRDGQVRFTTVLMRDNDDARPMFFFPLNLGVPPASNELVVAVTVYLDSQPTRPSLFSKYKTSYTKEYDDARSRVGISNINPGQHDALLYNKAGHVSGSASKTVYFWRDGRYVTPPHSSGCKLGVTRRWAINNANVIEADIPVDGLEEGEYIWMSSAVTGFSRGRVTLQTKHRPVFYWD
ncbi:Aminodeoxychorismate lyase [Conoideocrella luteorostrata]|uniref:Aminodeoxychorismate lyase n=1 Tax=Conoideocrella luteorostrata TaxID=1105319 RepID=A0AAJ0FYB4_9HYPO|nr:Aminodeoxychorismate lyase [Conoideocrella luteorostrata]